MGPGGRHVVKPDNDSEVARVLRIASETASRIVPRGSSDRGGNVIELDLSGLDTIHAIEEQSLTVHAGSGIRLSDLELALRDHGYTIGFPLIPHLDPKLGGFLSGQGWAESSVLFGRPWKSAIGIEGVLPTGRLFKIKPAPRRAVGPDLCELFLGAEGRLGVLTSAWVKFHPLPKSRMIVTAAMPGPGPALRCAARMIHDGLRPAFARIHEFGLLPEKSRDSLGDGTVLVVGFEGETRLVDVFHSMAVDKIHDSSGDLLAEDHPLALRRVRTPCSMPEMADHLTATVAWREAEPLLRKVSGVLGEGLEGVRISDFLHEGCAITWSARVDRAGLDEQLVRTIAEAVEAVGSTGGTVIAHHGPFARSHPSTVFEDRSFSDLMQRLVTLLDPSGTLNP
jgi:alkyldihydroxyacetonephosphate synthase